MPVSELNKLALWSKMDTIDLSEMNTIKLMNRIDTKFIASKDKLSDILTMALPDYRVQTIDGLRVCRYDTIYFDTEGLSMYMLHHNGRLVREKIRTRTYVESNISFLEIKDKTNKGRTKKKRIEIDTESFRYFKENPDAVNFLREKAKYTSDILLPQVRTRFDRITLVNKEKTERLTIDTNLSFENMQSGKVADVPNLMIIELKQDGLVYSEMKHIMNVLRIHKTSVSKYCVGTVLTNPNAKSNRFHSKIRKIEKITNEKL